MKTHRPVSVHPTCSGPSWRRMRVGAISLPAFCIAYASLRDGKHKLLDHPSTAWIYTTLSRLLHIPVSEIPYSLIIAAIDLLRIFLRLIPVSGLCFLWVSMSVVVGVQFLHRIISLFIDLEQYGDALFSIACVAGLACTVIVLVYRNALLKQISRIL